MPVVTKTAGAIWCTTYASCLLLLLMITTSGVRAFNIDVRTVSFRAGEDGSMFGFTVAQHVDRGQNWILVGAPNANTTQQNLVNPGAVYRCSVDNSQCQQVPFDTQGNNREWNGAAMVQVENKSRQWFGASLAATTASSTTSPGMIAACAPLYVLYGRKQDREGPIGNCFLSRPKTSQQSGATAGGSFVGSSGSVSAPQSASFNYQRYSPCRNGAPGFSKLGQCQFGFSVVINETLTWTKKSTYNNILVKYPECVAMRRDSAVVINASSVARSLKLSHVDHGQVIAQDVNDDQEFFETPEGPPTNDNSFMGYSIAVGHFNDDKLQDYAVGVTKGNNMTGMVTILSNRLEILVNLTGEQVGEYFGGSLATADFNGDGLDDLAVGAPFFSHSSTDGFDCGRVFVFHQNKNREFSGPTKLHGSKRSRSRFGFALSSLGDINFDGFQDLVVGSPYDGAEGRGTVYIFNGSPQGLRSTPSQVIQASDLGNRLSTFGYSISAGTDLDRNGYSDVIVGAYAADKVIYLRSKPVIKIDTKLRIEPEFIDIEARSCKSRDQQVNSSCFSIKCCMNFSGLNVPSEIELGLQWKLDSAKEHSQRAMFLGSTEHVLNDSILLVRNRERCKTQKAYIREKIRDKISPISVEVKYTLTKPTRQHISDAEELEPVLEEYISKAVTAQAQIMKRCGAKQVCIPELSVSVQSSTKVYTLGSETELDLRVVVENRGDDAFEAVTRIFIPPELEYINVDLVRAPSSVEFLCLQPDNNTDGDVVCDVGNPLPARGQVVFILRTLASKALGQTRTLQFNVQVNSSNSENSTTTINNMATYEIPVKAVLNITLTGVSHPEYVLANATWLPTFENEAEIGPLVIHLYEVTNFGPSRVGSMRTTIYWPSTLSDGSHLLYLLSTPRVIRGTGSCTAQYVNPLNVTLETVVAEESVMLIQLARTAKLRSERDRRKAGDQFIEHVECKTAGTTGCTKIVCDTGAMHGRDDSALIEIRSRAFANTLLDRQSTTAGFRIRSRAITEVRSLPYGADVRRELNAVDRYDIETFVAAVGVGPLRQHIEFWVIALAIIGGCVLLFLIVALLWKCGFFKRQQPGDEVVPQYKVTKTTSTNESSATQYHQVKTDDAYN